MSTQDLVMAEIQRRVENVGLRLVVDYQYANRGQLYATDGLDPVGVALAFAFDPGVFTFCVPNRAQYVAYWTEGKPKGPVIETALSYLYDPALDLEDPVRDVAAELTMHWNVERDKALTAALAFADQGGDGSGMTFAEQVAENTAYVVAEFMIDNGHVARGEVR